MQNKYRVVAHGQLLDAAFEIYPVKRSLQQQVRCANIDAWGGGFIVWVESRFDRDGWWRLLAKTHQHEVNRQSVQPSREGRFAAEGVKFAEQKQKGLLSQIFRVGCVSYHAQAYRIHTPACRR